MPRASQQDKNLEPFMLRATNSYHLIPQVAAPWLIVRTMSFHPLQRGAPQ